MNHCKSRRSIRRKIYTNRKPNLIPVRGKNVSLVVKVFPLVAVSEWANGCPFVLEENRKKGNDLPKVILRLNLQKGY